MDVKPQYFIHIKRHLSEQEVPAEVAQGIGDDQSQKRHRRKDTFPRDFHLLGAGRTMTVRVDDERPLIFRDVFLLLRRVLEEYVEDHAPNQR